MLDPTSYTPAILIHGDGDAWREVRNVARTDFNLDLFEAIVVSFPTLSGSHPEIVERKLRRYISDHPERRMAIVVRTREDEKVVEVTYAGNPEIVLGSRIIETRRMLTTNEMIFCAMILLQTFIAEYIGMNDWLEDMIQQTTPTVDDFNELLVERQSRSHS